MEITLLWMKEWCFREVEQFFQDCTTNWWWI